MSTDNKILENESALLNLLREMKIKFNENAHTPSSSNTVLLNKKNILEYFNESVIKNYAEDNWTEDNIDIKDFIKFLLKTPDLFTPLKI